MYIIDFNTNLIYLTLQDILNTTNEHDLMDISEEKKLDLRKAAAFALLSTAVSKSSTAKNATISPGPSSSSSSSSSPISKTVNLTIKDSKSSQHSKKF